MPLAGDADELADADVFDGLVAVEAGAQAIDERALDDQPEPVVSHQSLTRPHSPAPLPIASDDEGDVGQPTEGRFQSTSARRIAVRRG